MPVPYRWLIKIIIVFCAYGLAVSQAEPKWQLLPDAINKSERDPSHYQAIRLENGMLVVLASDPQAIKSLASLAVPVGSLQDPNQQLGLAHYLEHMVLMGSKRYPKADELAQFLKKHGGNYNAGTNPDVTVYYLEVENAALAPAVDRLADAIAQPLLSEENSDRERNAVNAEMTLARSNDRLRMLQVAAETLNPAHPGARFSGGNLETLSDKPGSKLHQALRDFYQRYYSSNLMVGVLYSNQPTTALAKLAAETYGKIPNRRASVPEITVPAVTSAQKGIIIHYVPAQPQKALQIEFKTPHNVRQFRSKTDNYISYLLNNRSDNTLSNWLQQQGLAESLFASNKPVADGNGSQFTISIALTDKGKQNRDQVIAAVFSYLKLLRTQGIQQRYFDEFARTLALAFRYPAFSRNMDYVAWMTTSLLRVPVQNILDADYLADQYNPKAIAERLDNMTPEQARIWFIGPDEPHNKMAYFVAAPYQVNKIKPEQFTRWQKMQKQISLSLPVVNPYIPDDFSLIEPPKNKSIKPQVIVNRPGLRALYSPGHYFTDEPKAVIQLALRTPDAQETTRQQVLSELLSYLAELSQTQLRGQAAVGGVYFSSGVNHGLQVMVSGFSQRISPLLIAWLKDFKEFTPTEYQLIQAKSSYREQLDAIEKSAPLDLALQPMNSLSFVPYSEPDERRQLLQSINLAELLAYRTALLRSATPELLVVGNLTGQQVTQLAENVQKLLATEGKEFWYGENVRISKAQTADLRRQSSTTDAALAAVYIPTGYSEVEGRAYSNLLAQIIQPLFYQQLRTEQQLGYAVFAFASSIGRQSGLGFLVQSNQKSPADLYQRYQAFYPTVVKRLQTMSDAEFAQYQQALVNQLRQQPQTLDEEARRLSNDFNRGNLAFDSRDKLIAQILALKRPQTLNYYRQAVLKPQGLALLSQVAGQGQKQNVSSYASPVGWQHYATVSALQQTLRPESKP